MTMVSPTKATFLFLLKSVENNNRAGHPLAFSKHKSIVKRC